MKGALLTAVAVLASCGGSSSRATDASGGATAAGDGGRGGMSLGSSGKASSGRSGEAGQAPGAGTGGTAAGGRGAGGEPSSPLTGPCPDPVGDPADIAATPNGDPNLEQLALTLDSDRVTAASETYERVVADVEAIRELAPELADVHFFPPDDGKTLLLRFAFERSDDLMAGRYTAWDCLNDFYGLESLQVSTYDNLMLTYVELTLKGIYNLKLLGAVYARLPLVESVEPNFSGGDGPTICAARDGSTYDYVMDRAGGDCPAGCTEHVATHFRSAVPGKVEALETWDSGTNPSNPPTWFTDICR